MNIHKFSIVLGLILITSCAYDQDDHLNQIPVLETHEAIAADSDLFENLKGIASHDERPDKSIVCIDFIYPLTLFVFDENTNYLYTSQLNNDQEFSSFLEAIDLNYTISMSFPITSTLDSGEAFTINNKEELKNAIDSCLSNELVYECGELIRHCVWKIGYSFEDSNPYLGSVFQEDDGFTTLAIDGDLLSGSWSPFTIENELHINININDTTAIADYFNRDWKATYIDANSLKLTHLDHELILNQRCDPNFSSCGNFNFEACETELNSGSAEFILNDYSFCIFDTLEFDDEDFNIVYFETEDDALSMSNPINSEAVFTTTEAHQTIYVLVKSIETNLDYYLSITLSAIQC
ncbi:hypothetical protein [Psychroserpens sp. SPM9]|uniref:hypothetical protein n=1 Tax=Psychroserpens sp. SPM9 TaxID=2975598 RepID=UPI0021A52A90|nr:hypothetical protein [Psychroserpens sp. SPM9]MDG5490116.1 hypothetical protein [Psychroserpens sp. SPM9]